MKRGTREILRDFYSHSRRSFQVICYEWLSFLFPDLRDTVDLGERDREGVDLYCLDDAMNYSKVFQCKGFEKPFGNLQMEQCIQSIHSFIDAGIHSSEYFLLINNHIDSTQHAALEAALQKVIDSGLCERAEYYTPQTFIHYYKKEFQSYIMFKIKESNQNFFESYLSVMEQTFYLDRVPFTFNKDSDPHPTEDVNPLKFLWMTCKADNVYKGEKTLSKLKSKHLLIISEFGFGKTSLLLQFFSFLQKKNYIPIYLPVASFRTNSFRNTSNLSREIFRTITQLDLDQEDKFLKFSSEAMGSLLQTNPKIVLMFDGLDEHRDLYNRDALKILFESSIGFVSPTLFSFRKSFWEERHEDFEFAINRRFKRKNFQFEVYLLEWLTSTIQQYLELFIKKQSGLPDNQLQKIEALKTLLVSDRYQEYYGDIPKRPLFLEMIIRDVLSDTIKKRNISELYFAYFIEKFHRDLEGQLQGFPPHRDTLEKSIGSTLQVLVRIHEKAAGKCLKIESDGTKTLIIENLIEEEELSQILRELNFSLDLGKFFSISVLVPISKRRNVGLKIRFVHKSFMEYFIARYLFKDLLEKKNNQREYQDFQYSQTILNFLKGIIQADIKENKSILEQTLFHYKNDSNIIVDFFKSQVLQYL